MWRRKRGGGDLKEEGGGEERKGKENIKKETKGEVGIRVYETI